MNPTKLYYGIFFTLTGLAMMAVPIVDYVRPGFYNYDMCSKSYMDSQGHPNAYDRTNSQELINACYTAKNIFLNPIIQSFTDLGFSYLTIRFMLLGSKAEFVKSNPDPKWRWEEDSNNYSEPQKIVYYNHNCNTCKYQTEYEYQLDNHIRLTGHKRQMQNEVAGQ